MTVLDTDLTTETDAVLDEALTRLFALHGEADRDERAELHLAITEILDEQSRRLDVWIEGRLA